MKKLIFITAILQFSSTFLSAQDDTISNSKIYIAWIKLNDGHTLSGALYQTNDSSVQIANPYTKKVLLSGNYNIERIYFNNIRLIKIRAKEKAGKGFMFTLGATGGALIGAIIGYSLGNDPYAGGYTAGDKAILGGMIGLLPGGLIGIQFGASKKKIPVIGSIYNFNLSKELLRIYSYKQ
jgi:hypothetical protein